MVDITVHEGRNRQVRRMFEALGHPVQTLVRLRFGPIALGDLPIGHSRPLDPEGTFCAPARCFPGREDSPSS